LPFEGFAEFFVELAAWLLFVAGACFRWWATLFVGGRKSSELIVDGAYSVCRNPLYFGTFLMTLSVAVFLQSITLIVVICLVSAGYLYFTVTLEERKLAAIHGRAFAEYCERVPRFLPNLFLHKSPEEVTVRLQGIRSEARRMAQWLWVPVLCYLVEHLRMLPAWPANLLLP
jgi:hypothetical protein